MKFALTNYERFSGLLAASDRCDRSVAGQILVEMSQSATEIPPQRSVPSALD